MNRQEAIDRLKNEVKRIEEMMENGDCGCVDMDTWNEFAKKAEWRETLIELLSGPQPDPITGLVPCGCGGEVYPHYQLGWCHESGVQAFEVSTGCDGCGTYTKPRRGHYVNGIDKDDIELASKRDWNTSHGYTDPPLPEMKG